MKLSEKEELEKLRARKKRNEDYVNQYNKDNYRRMVCMCPKVYSEAIDVAMEQTEARSVSAYLVALIERDLKDRGLMK